MSEILDSGDRTEFATGAVRDMREGKGRCDLMPLRVIAKCWRYFGGGDARDEADAMVLSYIADFQDTGNTEWLLKALNYFQGYMCWGDMFLDVAKHFEEGAKKYGESNWQKGIPVHCYIDSAVRHYLKWLRGDQDEPHDRAFVWNLMCCIWEVDYSPRAANEESDPKKLQEKAQEILKEMGNEPIKATVTQPEAALLPVTKIEYGCRLGDYGGGLFEFDGDVYVKVPAFYTMDHYVHVLTGAVRELHPDLVITPLQIWEVDGDEDE